MLQKANSLKQIDKAKRFKYLSLNL